MNKASANIRTLFFLGMLAFSTSLAATYQLNNLSSIFKFLGLNNNKLSYLWLAPPVTGLILQPIIGQLSDDTMTRYGKRRPYIFCWGLLTAFTFCLFSLFDSLIILALLVLISDATLNATVEASRTLTSDLTRNEERSRAFALLAFFGGLGSAIGAALPFLLNKLLTLLNYYKQVIPGHVPFYLKVGFLISGLIVGVIIFFTVYHLKEKNINKSNLLNKKKKPRKLISKIAKPFIEVVKNIPKMSSKLKRYCFIHAVCWIGIFIFWLFFTTMLAQNFYHLPLDASSSLECMKIMQKANLDTSYYFSIYQYVSVGTALFLFYFSSKFSMKLLHAIALSLGGISLLLMPFITSETQVLIAMIGIGIMWGSMCTLPYAIVTQILPKNKIGVYLGIFNISITLPQIICGFTLSPLFVFVFKNHAVYLISFAGLILIGGGCLWMYEEFIAFKLISNVKNLFIVKRYKAEMSKKTL